MCACVWLCQFREEGQRDSFDCSLSFYPRRFWAKSYISRKFWQAGIPYTDLYSINQGKDSCRRIYSRDIRSEYDNLYKEKVVSYIVIQKYLILFLRIKLSKLARLYTFDFVQKCYSVCLCKTKCNSVCLCKTQLL